jgi:hypothetical protein
MTILTTSLSTLISLPYTYKLENGSEQIQFITRGYRMWLAILSGRLNGFSQSCHTNGD